MYKRQVDGKSLSHTSWNCKYHIVLVPKYRRKVIYLSLIHILQLRTGLAKLPHVKNISGIGLMVGIE